MICYDDEYYTKLSGWTYIGQKQKVYILCTTKIKLVIAECQIQLPKPLLITTEKLLSFKLPMVRLQRKPKLQIKMNCTNIGIATRLT